MRGKTIVKTYRDVAIEQMIVTVEEAMSQAIDYWGDLPPSMKEAVEQFRTQLGAGRARLATSPLATGSLLTTTTMGIEAVAPFTIGACSPPNEKITSGLRRTNSAASPGRRL